MGVVLMSQRELYRIDVLARLDGGRLRPLAAADLMRLTRDSTWPVLGRNVVIAYFPTIGLGELVRNSFSRWVRSHFQPQDWRRSCCRISNR
jgi:hypothetical protein